jgi:hypothetical protein
MNLAPEMLTRALTLFVCFELSLSYFTGGFLSSSRLIKSHQYSSTCSSIFSPKSANINSAFHFQKSNIAKLTTLRRRSSPARFPLNAVLALEPLSETETDDEGDHVDAGVGSLIFELLLNCD